MGFTRAQLTAIAVATGYPVKAAWTTGHGVMGDVAGVLLHHTATPDSTPGDYPSLRIVTEGRPGLAGPLCNYGLGRSGTIYLVTEGIGWHAGVGEWKGVTAGNTHLIGIEAENAGSGSPWPAVQLDAYQRLTASILYAIGRGADWAIRHAVWALPAGRKIDTAGIPMDPFMAAVRGMLADPSTINRNHGGGDMIGADYSLGRPGGAALAAAGVQVVGRYAAAGRANINITAAEVRDLRAHGIDVFVYNEHEAGYMKGGAARAATVVPGAVKVCRDAGLPDGPIFYAIDFDATRGGVPTSAGALADMRALADFLTEAARITGWGQVGVYGGYYVVGWLLDHLPGLKHTVQTSAWSGGRWEPRAFCRQDAYNWTINGVNCDHLTVVNPDEGSLRYRTGADDMSQADVDKITAYIDKKFSDVLLGAGNVSTAVFSGTFGKNPDGSDRTAGQLIREAASADDVLALVKANDAALSQLVQKVVTQTDTLEASEASQSAALGDAVKNITNGVVAQLLGSGIVGIDEPKLRAVVGDAVHAQLAGTEFIARPAT